MNILREVRESRGYSQRRLAEKARLSFKGLQLMEKEESGLRLSSLMKIFSALGLSSGGLDRFMRDLIFQDPNSILNCSMKILDDGEASWKIHLFDFVDAFRRERSVELIELAPANQLSKKLTCLLASCVESLCDEIGQGKPGWCRAVLPLDTPWFVSGFENLKATALKEAPIHFRRRGVFVLGNFLDRL